MRRWDHLHVQFPCKLSAHGDLMIETVHANLLGDRTRHFRSPRVDSLVFNFSCLSSRCVTCRGGVDCLQGHEVSHRVKYCRVSWLNCQHRSR